MDKNKFFADLFKVVEEKLSNASGCHDFDHTRRVMANAEVLCRKIPAADNTVVRFAALLHDIARPEEMAAKGKICHAAAGAAAAESLLRKQGLDENFILAVTAAVRTHRYRSQDLPPQTTEAMIVYDADKLDSLGAVGIGRAFLFAGREGARLHNLESEAVNSEAYSRDDTAYREYLIKLRHLPEAMLTVPGKILAAERLDFMKKFFDELNAEVFGATSPAPDSDIK